MTNFFGREDGSNRMVANLILATLFLRKLPTRAWNSWLWGFVHISLTWSQPSEQFSRLGALHSASCTRRLHVCQCRSMEGDEDISDGRVSHSDHAESVSLRCSGSARVSGTRDRKCGLVNFDPSASKRPRHGSMWTARVTTCAEPAAGVHNLQQEVGS